MNVNELLDTIEDALEESANVPLSGGKRIVDVEQIRDYLDEVRAALPGELRQAQQIVNDRAQIVDSANAQAQAIVKKAAVTRLGEKYGLGWLPETGETYQLRFSIMKDHVELFLDTSGVRLHKRGYRREANLAPLHETMAAAMVNLARYRGRDFFWDPFCGSGTICIEAAMIALNRAPGLNRSFMAQKWSCVPETVWQQARTEALDREYRGEYHILGSDIDAASLEIAQQNARKAGVGKLIEFREADATKMSLPTDKGLLVCNPPYGERMLEQRSAQRLYGAFGRHLKYADGWKKYIISSEPEFEHYYGKQAVKKRKLYNGRLQCNVYMYY